jgi:hypothetical protein
VQIASTKHAVLNHKAFAEIADTFVIWDNNGLTPFKIAEKIDGELVILNERAYNRFLENANANTEAQTIRGLNSRTAEGVSGDRGRAPGSDEGSGVRRGEVAESPGGERQRDLTQDEGGGALEFKPGDDIANRLGQDLKRTKKGGFVGATKDITGVPKLRKLIQDLEKLRKGGEAGRFWYEESAQKVRDAFHGDVEKIDQFLQILARTSQGERVGPNFNAAIKAIQQSEAGARIDTGRFPETMRPDIEAILRGESWNGRKTNSFYINLMQEIDPKRVEDLVTNDRWMARAFGHTKDSFTDAQYEFASSRRWPPN